jgi:hypothetical protein
MITEPLANKIRSRIPLNERQIAELDLDYHRIESGELDGITYPCKEFLASWIVLQKWEDWPHYNHEWIYGN